ncbi:MAG: Uma2 family endonuclease [Gemmataceae bacterium]
MGRAKKPPLPFTDVGELLADLGGITPARIRLFPSPGTATEDDLIRANERKEGGVYELVNGTLVRKVMGWGESCLATDLVGLLRPFIRAHDLGDLAGADSMVKLMSGLVRVPDLAFVRWAQYPDRQRPTEPVPELYPDLAVEVLSAGNTRGEMLRKRKEYFLAGTSLVWEVDPRRREIDVYTAPDARTTLTEADTLDGGTVLPGFRVSVADVFALVPRVPAPKPRRRKK